MAKGLGAWLVFRHRYDPIRNAIYLAWTAPKGSGDTTESWWVEIVMGAVRQDRKQQELERRGTFVLITTVSQERLSSEELLREYKSQTSVERHFHFVKDPWFVDGWFLKKAERLEALGYVILLACLLYRLVERRVRRSGLSIPSPSRWMLTHPTGREERISVPIAASDLLKSLSRMRGTKTDSTRYCARKRQKLWLISNEQSIKKMSGRSSAKATGNRTRSSQLIWPNPIEFAG